MSNRDIEASRAAMQAKAEQMLRELLVPETPPKPLPQTLSQKKRTPNGQATVAIEELAVKVIRRQYWMFGSDLRFFGLAAAGRSWPGPQGYNEHLTALMTRLVEDGIATGEFKRRDAATAARALLECLKSLTHPMLSRSLGRHGAELRARAQVRFLARALA